jgi:WD40 repeat protein
VVSAQFSPDGGWIVTASADRTARIWNSHTGELVTILRGHEQALVSAAFSPDSSRVVTAAADGTVRLWRVAIDHAYMQPLRNHNGPVYSVAFSPDGQRLVTSSEDRMARIWDVAGKKGVTVLQAGAGMSPAGTRQHIFGPVHQATPSPDGRLALTMAHDVQACLGSPLAGGKRTLIPLPFTPVRIWDAQTGKEQVGFQWQARKGNSIPTSRE